MRVISVSQIASLDTMIVYLLDNGQEITQPDNDGSKWVNRAYYIGKEMSEVDGRWVIHN